MALWHRDHGGHRVGAGLIHHSDAGSQYTSIAFTAHLAAEGIVPSIGSVGDALDNALMESAIGLYKTELTGRRGPWRDLAHAGMETAGYLHWFNNRRIHSAIGDVTGLSGRPPGTPHAAGKDGKNEKEAACAAGFPEMGCRAVVRAPRWYRPAPPASTVLRIALARDGLRPRLTPETSGGPQRQQSGQPKGAAPGEQRRPPARHAAGQALHRHPERRDTGTRQPPLDTSGHLFDYVNRQKNYKADRRSAAELSLNRSRGAPDRLGVLSRRATVTMPRRPDSSCRQLAARTQACCATLHIAHTARSSRLRAASPQRSH